MRGTRDLEGEAERLIRLAATMPRPVDPGLIAQVGILIREAHDRGQEELRDLAEAELRELARMPGGPDPEEVEAVRTYLRKLHFYGVPESAEEELEQLGRS